MTNGFKRCAEDDMEGSGGEKDASEEDASEGEVEGVLSFCPAFFGGIKVKSVHVGT